LNKTPEESFKWTNI